MYRGVSFYNTMQRAIFILYLCCRSSLTKSLLTPMGRPLSCLMSSYHGASSNNIPSYPSNLYSLSVWLLSPWSDTYILSGEVRPWDIVRLLCQNKNYWNLFLALYYTLPQLSYRRQAYLISRFPDGVSGNLHLTDPLCCSACMIRGPLLP